MTGEAGVGCWEGGWGGLLDEPFLPQLLHAGTDRLEIVSCSVP
jgi:hypothetical protein